MRTYPSRMSAKNMIKEAPGLTLEEAEAWLDVEEKGKARSTVMRALRGRRDELNSERRKEALPEVKEAVAAAAAVAPSPILGAVEMSSNVAMES